MNFAPIKPNSYFHQRKSCTDKQNTTNFSSSNSWMYNADSAINWNNDHTVHLYTAQKNISIVDTLIITYWQEKYTKTYIQYRTQTYMYANRRPNNAITSD